MSRADVAAHLSPLARDMRAIRNASIRTLRGPPFWARCMMGSVQGGRCNLSFGLDGPLKEAQSPGLGVWLLLPLPSRLRQASHHGLSCLELPFLYLAAFF